MSEDGAPLGEAESSHVQDTDAKRTEMVIFLKENGDVQMNKKRLKAVLAMSPSGQLAFKLGVVIAHCCKHMDLEKAFTAYLNSKKDGISPSSDTFANLISLTAGFGEQGSGLGPIRDREPPSDINAAMIIFDDMKLCPNIKRTESIYTAMIRCCCMNERGEQAMLLYREMVAILLRPKLRTYFPLLTFYSQTLQCEICFQLLHDLIYKFGLLPTEREYTLLLRVTCNLRDFRFYAILHAFMEDVMVPSKEPLEVLRTWFQGCEGCAVTSSLVDPSGRVLCNGAQLVSIDLSDATRNALLVQVEKLATEQTALVSNRSLGDSDDTVVDTTMDRDASSVGGVKRVLRRVRGSDSRREKWVAFRDWLANTGTTMSAYDVVIDGANVGFYKQNFPGAPANVDYKQIDWMVRKLQLLGHSPLLLLHCRHDQDAALPDQEARDILKRWKNEKILYLTPAGCNDDWYWLYCAVLFKCKLVSNDEMRDHHFQMLSPRWFERWKERHQIHFSFGPWGVFNPNDRDGEEIALSSLASIAAASATEDNTKKDNADADNVSSKRRRYDWTLSKWRAPRLDIPRPFSFRMQRIQEAGADAGGAFICDDDDCSDQWTELWMQEAALRAKYERSRASYYFPSLDSEEWLCVFYGMGKALVDK